MEYMLSEITKLFPHLNTYLAAGTFIFARLIGFIRFAPVFNRKEIPGMVKISLALIAA